MWHQLIIPENRLKRVRNKLFAKYQERLESLLTVSMGKNVAFNSLKMLTGDSSRKSPTTV